MDQYDWIQHFSSLRVISFSLSTADWCGYPNQKEQRKLEVAVSIWKQVKGCWSQQKLGCNEYFWGMPDRWCCGHLQAADCSIFHLYICKQININPSPWNAAHAMASSGFLKSHAEVFYALITQEPFNSRCQQLNPGHLAHTLETWFRIPDLLYTLKIPLSCKRKGHACSKNTNETLPLGHVHPLDLN